MVDYWEVLGRMVTDDALRKNVFDSFTLGTYTVDPLRFRVTIAEDMFKTLSKLMNAVIPDRPVSLLCLGELLFNISFSGFRDSIGRLADIIKRANVSTASATPLFYGALGAMTVDDTVRDLFEGKDFEKAQFGALVPPERDELRKLTAPNGAFQTETIALCDDFWSPQCKLKLNFYKGHQHPVDNLPPSFKTPKLALRS